VIIVTPDPVGDYLRGDCDVLVSDRSALGPIKFSAPSDPWVILTQTLSKEPLAPVVSDGDDEWLAIVTWSVNALIYADEVGITAGNINARRNESSAVSTVFGVAAPTGTYLGLDANWAYRAVNQVGSYGEIYATNLEPVGLARAGSLNASYLDGGLIYAPPIK
jgi:general L-amino acid transport system substrate-binding protein